MPGNSSTAKTSQAAAKSGGSKDKAGSNKSKPKQSKTSKASIEAVKQQSLPKKKASPRRPKMAVG